MYKLVEILKKLISEKFTGTLEINFNQGGVRGIKQITRKVLL